MIAHDVRLAAGIDYGERCEQIVVLVCRRKACRDWIVNVSGKTPGQAAKIADEHRLTP